MSGQDALIFLLQTLKEVAKDYKDIKKWAGLEFEKLQNELGLLEAHLKDASNMQKKDHTLQEKEKQIRRLVYEVEDTIDNCLADKAASKTRNIIRRIPGIMRTTMEVKVRDLRLKKVGPALKLLEPPPPDPKSGNAEAAAEGSTRGLVKLPTAGLLKESESGSYKENSISSSIKNKKTWDVELTYRALSHDRRVCFLYTGLFPENYKISASTLTQLWIAERFISQEDNKTLEETANEVLNDLISKELLVAHKMRLDQVRTCLVDDEIRNFCKQKAKEESLFTVVESEFNAKQSFYRLCFHSDPSEFLSQAHNSSNVRSFLCLVKDDPINLNPKHSSTILNAFKPLRILKCESTRFDELPKNFTSLKLLKHITLWIDKLDVLPEQVSKLSYLQTLIIKTESKSITVKANIWKMMQLRHLKARVSFVLDDKKWKEGKATNLQTISRLSSKSCSPTLSKKAPKLKSLGIQGELTVHLLETLSLESFQDLEKLKLVNYVPYGTPRALDRLPLVDRFPLKLKSLTLSNTKLLWNRHIAKLAEIDTLEELKLKDNAFKGASWKARSENVFEKLKFLLIKNTDLVTWDASTANFPLLECLVIKKCEQFKNVPDGLARQVKKLQINNAKSRNSKLN